MRILSLMARMRADVAAIRVQTGRPLLSRSASVWLWRAIPGRRTVARCETVHKMLVDHEDQRICRIDIYEKAERKPSSRLLKHVTASLRAGVAAIPATDRYAVALPSRTGSAAASDSGTHD